MFIIALLYVIQIFFYFKGDIHIEAINKKKNIPGLLYKQTKNKQKRLHTKKMSYYCNDSFIHVAYNLSQRVSFFLTDITLLLQSSHQLIKMLLI